MAELAEITDQKLRKVKLMFKKSSRGVDLSQILLKTTVANTRKAAKSWNTVERIKDHSYSIFTSAKFLYERDIQKTKVLKHWYVRPSQKKKI